MSTVTRAVPVSPSSAGPNSIGGTLRQIAGWLLPGAPPITDLVDGDARSLVSLARAEQLLGPLLLAVDQGGMDLPDEQVAAARADHEDAMRWCLQLEARLLQVVDSFDKAGGVRLRVLKGVAAAHLDEPDPSLRSFSDVDILIDAADMDRAIAALEASGATRRRPQRRPGFDRRFAKGVGVVYGDLVEIDVHRTLCGGALGVRIPLDRLFAESDGFVLGGRTFETLRLEHRALHAAYHATVGGGRASLRTLRDLAGYLTHPELSPGVLGREARFWGGEAVLAAAVRLTFDQLTFDAPEWTAWLGHMHPEPGELALIESRSRPPTSPVEWSMVRELDPRDRVGEFQRSVHGPGMIAGAVDRPRPLENPGCQARRCRCPNAKRSASR